MALTNMALKTKNWSHFGEEETVEKKERRRRRGEEEIKQKRYGTLDFWYGNYFEYGFSMDLWNSKAWYG